MKKLLMVCLAMLSVITTKATTTGESGKYYFYAYDQTNSTDGAWIELTQSSTDESMYYATGNTFNSSTTNLTTVQIVYGNWETEYSVNSAITLGTVVTLKSYSSTENMAWIYNWTLSSDNYIYFDSDTKQLVISADSTNPLCTITALLKADSWTAPCTASYYTSSSSSTAISSDTLSCVSPGCYLVNIPDGTNSIVFADSNSGTKNTATATYPTTTSYQFVYDVSSSAWTTEAYQSYKYDSSTETFVENNGDGDEAYGLYYKYYYEDKNVEISGLKYDPTPTTSELYLELPSFIADTTFNVTGVGEAAFCKDTNWNTSHSYTGELANVDFPSSVTYISAGAFKGCVNIKGNHDNTDTEGDVYETKGKGIYFPKDGNLKTIGNYAFQECDSLDGIRFPATLTSIGKGAFQGCDSLLWVDFHYCKNLTDLGDSTFVDCKKIKDLYLPNTLDSIRANTFYNIGEFPSYICYGVDVAKELTTFTSCLTGYYPNFGSTKKGYVDGDTNEYTVNAYSAYNELKDSTYVLMNLFTGIAAQGEGLVIQVENFAGKTYFEVPLTTTVGTAIEGNLMKGYMENDSSNIYFQDMYFLYNSNFMPANPNGAYLAKGKAYLDLRGVNKRPSSSSAAKGIAISFASTMGINTVATASDTTDAWYNIAGERVLQPTRKGLYIHNGKKVLVK